MNLRNLQAVKIKLMKYLKDTNVIDIIVFGSVMKGKALPRDIDIAVIMRKKEEVDISGFHVSTLIPEDLFGKPISLIHTLFREGYSLKHNMFFSEIYKFSTKIMFTYELVSLKASVKVRVVNVLRGKGKENGMVIENGGKWIANQVFIVPINAEDILEKFFLNFNVKFKKFYLLIH